MISKQYFETTFSLDTAQALQEWADINLIANPDAPPIYDLTEPLVNDGSFDYLDNSAASGSQFDGKLLTSGDTAWNPTAQEYPQDGTIDFGTNYADTQWTPPSNAEYTFTFVEDVADNSYSMVSINPKGDGLTADVLYDGVLTAENTGLNYTPPTESVKLTENMSQTIVPMIPTCKITMSQYVFYEGDTATVTLAFSTVLKSFNIAYIIAANGSMSNLVQDANSPWIYTATFTPDPDVNDDTNSIYVDTTLFTIRDQWDNNMTVDPVSTNYRVDTVTAAGYVVYINFDSGSETFPYTVNQILQFDLSDAPSDFVDSEGTVTGVSLVPIGVFEATINGDDVADNCLGDARFADKAFVNQSQLQATGFTMTLPAGTYDFKMLSDANTAATDREGIFTLDGADKTHDSSTNNTGSKCISWTGVTGGRSIDFNAVPSSGTNKADVNAFKITKVG